MKEDSIGKHGLSIELFSVLLWSNVGFVAVYLMLFAVDWLFVNWVSPDAGQVEVAIHVDRRQFDYLFCFHELVQRLIRQIG